MERATEFLSFLASVLIYLLAVLALTLFISKNEFKFDDTKYTIDKDAFIDVSVLDIDDSLMPESPQKQDEILESSEKILESKEEIEEEKLKTTNKPTTPEISQSVEKKDKPKDEILEPNLDDKKAKEEEPKKEEIKKEEIKDESKDDRVQSRQKSDKKTKINPKSSTTQTSDKKGEKAKGRSQNTGAYNKFRGEVDTTLRRVWSSYRAMPNQDAVVEITIDKNGKLSYKIIELAYDTQFNQKLRDFLGRIERMKFPAPPDGNSFTHRYKMKDLVL